MSVPGLTAAGLEVATLADVREQINTAWRARFGASMDVSDSSPDGQLIGIVAEIFALLWELLEAINSSQDPDKATGAFLRALAALIGTTADPATFSTVTATLTGVPTSSIPAGTLVSTASTEQQFVTTGSGPVVIASAPAWTDGDDYIEGDRVTNGGNVYLCVQDGQSGLPPGPVGEDPDPDVVEVDGTTAWRFLGEGTGSVDVVVRATVAGPIVAVAGDLTGIDEPAGGLQGVTNILDAELGALAMTDAELRVAMAQEVARPGTGPKDAIRAALLDVGVGTLSPVTSATVFHNITDVTDADGVPPHSVEALVRGGLDQDIFDALLANVVGGIRTHGSVVGTSIDAAGGSQTMKFSRTTEIDVYVSVTLTKDPTTYPADGDDQVKAALAAAGNAKDDGTNVASSAVLARVYAVPGIVEVSLPLIGTAPSPVATTTIPISLRQRAVFDTTRITVTSSDAVP